MPNAAIDLRPRTIAQAIEGMALTFVPEKGGDLEAVIQFHVSGDGGGEWYLDIAGGQSRCERGVAAEPTLTITTPADVWLAIARGELGGAKALMTGKYKARGKMGLLLRMDKLFSRQPTPEELAARGWLEEGP
jgi:putative sterol carrier protein